LDLQRFPGRAHLASVLRQHRAEPPQLHQETPLQDDVRCLWSEQLGCDPADLILAPTAGDAIRLLTSALLTAQDVAIVAEPMPGEWLASVLATGARYVDVGRRAAGEIDRDALDLALQRHPGAVAIGLAPSWFATDDGPALARVAPRATILDARMHASRAGSLAPDATAVLHALRDAATGGDPVLHGIVCARATGDALRLLASGLGRLTDLQRALQALRADPHLTALRETERAARHAQFVAWFAGEGGVRVAPRAGSCAALECLGGNAREVARRARAVMPGVRAFDTPVMRHIVVVDLDAPAFDRPETTG